jgi:hypothetical protein
LTTHLSSCPLASAGGESISVPRAAVALFAILVTAALFKLAFAPPLSAGPYVLIMSPVVHKNVEIALAHDWTALLLPFAYEPPRNFWSPTAIFLTYFVQNAIGAYGSYILWSSLFIGASFICALICLRSLMFASTLAFMFAFGTQLDYVYTYGNIITLYLVLTYMTLNATFAYLLLSERLSLFPALGAFALSLAVVALSNEMWINYATALLTGGLFGALWAHHHGNAALRARSLAIFGATLLVLAIYLSVRLRLASEYLAPGSEEELLVTYHSKLLLIDDLVDNFFTLLYMVLDNYFPSFMSSSNSLTYLDKALILGEQHGYDPAHQNLIITSHLYLWRFYAGVMVTLFGAFTAWVVVRAWRGRSGAAAITAALCLMVLAGFSTHLSIKMRSYNSVPALPYKVVVSVSFFTVLIAYLVARSATWFRDKRAHWGIVAGVWVCVLLAAVTRPGMENRLLAEVGLFGFSDPLSQILNWFR